MGQDHRILNSGTHPKDFFVNLWRTITRGETWRGEICNQAKDGSLYWIDTAIIPLKNDQGEIIRFISVRVDITQRKQHESELLTARQAADAANQAKSRFLANMSHEIRTPMNSIIGMTHLLDQTALDSKQIDYVAKIKNSSQHLLRIINEILDFSKIEAGKIEVAVKDLDLNKILSDVLDHLTSDLGDKNIELVSDVAPGLSQNFQGDALRLSQVLLNLISNAIKFTEAGKITVSACIEQESNIDCLVRFEIHDTGIG
ncbi:MAG: histidine kinase dimerization/phospho-acceptor domain-containing protein, partial [Pseudomonadota bacterium]